MSPFVSNENREYMKDLFKIIGVNPIVDIGFMVDENQTIIGYRGLNKEAIEKINNYKQNYYKERYEQYL